MKSLKSAICTLVVCTVTGLAAAQTWTPLTHLAPQAVGPLLQLRDGRVLAHSDQGGNANSWYILTPDLTGSYVNGTWTGPYNMQAGYSPFFFSSAVLLDGKTIIVEGGEYNNGTAVWTNLGAIGTLTPFAPFGITFQANAPPSGWTTIGDAQNSLLPDGRYFQANCCTKQTAYFVYPVWTPGPSVLAVRNDESGYTALPDGRVLMVDVQNNANCPPNTNMSTEYFNPAPWTCGPQTTVQLWQQSDQELGAAVLTYPSTPNHVMGSVVQFGGNVNATNVLDIKLFTWATGPVPPNNLDQADGPAALEPNNKILAMLSPGLFQSGCQFVEYDATNDSIALAPNSPQCPSDSSFEGHLMILPTGQLASVSFDEQIYVYTPAPGIAPGVQPTISSYNPSVCKPPTVCVIGSTNLKVCGTQLNGLTENNAYGDDYQAATNYPLIRLTDPITGHVYYAWTHDDSNHSIAPNNFSCTLYDLPPSIPTKPGGIAYNMEVVVNGIASNPVTVTVH